MRDDATSDDSDVDAGNCVEGASGGGDRLTVSSPSPSLSLCSGRQVGVGDTADLRQVDVAASLECPFRNRGGVIGKFTTGDAGVPSGFGRLVIRVRGSLTKYLV